MVLMIPVHATVIIFEFSISPELTITGGRGAMSAPPRHLIFAIVFPFCCGDYPHTPLRKLFGKRFSEAFQKLFEKYCYKLDLFFIILSYGGKNVNKRGKNLLQMLEMGEI
jgi:hypothetical protein